MISVTLRARIVIGTASRCCVCVWGGAGLYIKKGRRGANQLRKGGEGGGGGEGYRNTQISKINNSKHGGSHFLAITLFFLHPFPNMKQTRMPKRGG